MTIKRIVKSRVKSKLIFINMFKHIKLSSHLIEKNNYIVISLFCFYISCLWHFVNDFVDIPIISSLFPVNESVWEHSKIIFYPIVIVSFLELLFFHPKNTMKYINKVFYISIMSVFIMIVLFYTYSGAIGKHFLVVDILIVLIVDLISFYNLHKMNKQNIVNQNKSYFGILSGSFMFFLMIYLTYHPYHFPLFYDNKSNGYGIISN